MTSSRALLAVTFVMVVTIVSADTALAQAQAGPPAPVRVGGAIRAPLKIRDVRPVYPAAAQAARVEGVVIAELLIAAAGHVEQSRILKSVPLLDQAALDAVNQWVFTPTLLNGVAIPVLYNVTVSFQLSGGSNTTGPGPIPGLSLATPPFDMPSELACKLPQWDWTNWREPELPAGQAVRIAETWIKQQRPGVQLQLVDLTLRSPAAAGSCPVWFYVASFEVLSVESRPPSAADRTYPPVAIVFLDGSVVEPRTRISR